MDDDARMTWVPVAFVRQTGGRMHVLFSVESDDRLQHDGEPVLLVDHRPGGAHDDVAFEAASVLTAPVVAALEAHRADFAACFAAAFAADGSFDPDLLLAQRVETLHLT